MFAPLGEKNVPVASRFGTWVGSGPGPQRQAVRDGEAVGRQRLVEVVGPDVHQRTAVVAAIRQGGQTQAGGVAAVLGVEAEAVEVRLPDAGEGRVRRQAVVEVGVEEHDAALAMVRPPEGVEDRRPLHVRKVVRAGVAFQPERRDEVPQPDVADDGQVAEGQVEVGEADAADLDAVVVDVGHVLDVGEVDLADEVDLLPDRAVGRAGGRGGWSVPSW